jgi:hypothetical protein
MKQMEIINNLDEIIGTNQYNVDVHSIFKNVLNSINNNEISIEIEPAINNILNGMCFD